MLGCILECLLEPQCLAAVPTVPAGSSFPCMHAWPCLCSDAAADSVLTLLFAGHDTSATSLTRILWHLQAHPEAEARLRAEQVGCLQNM